MADVNYPPNSNDQLRRQLMLTWLLMGLIVVVFVWPTLKWWLGFGLSGSPRAITPRGELANYEKSTIEVFRTVSPSVMFVNVSSQVFSPFSRQALEVEAGTGSGFVWDDAGHIVTNYHVIQNASSARVVMFDQSVFEASLVGQSPDHDLAVLKINAPAAQIRPVAIGSSADLAVGQAVFAIGNPFGLSHTLTTGVVSAKSRTIRGPKSRIEDVIQVDAAINPGNSGGPLLDSAGRLIGVTTAIYSPSGASAGVGFAVPVDTVNRVVPQIIANGRYEPPSLGILVNQELSDMVTRRLGVSGVLISGVQPNSGAAAAGLRGTEIGRSNVAVLGDIIQEINEREVDSLDALLRALDTYSRGDSITITFLRDGEVKSATVTLE
jgi:S1-C subfamily serine protease